MSIFNNDSLDLRICEIYDIDGAYDINNGIYPIAYKSTMSIDLYDYSYVNKHWPECREVFDLCQVTNQEYQFLEYSYEQFYSRCMTTKEFTECCMKALHDCPIGSLQEMSKYINEHSEIPGKIDIDIIHDIQAACMHHTITKHWKSDSTKTYRVGFDFPSPYPYDRLKDNFMDCSWCMIYRYKEDAPTTMHLIMFPLIPKKGCIDIFKPY